MNPTLLPILFGLLVPAALQGDPAAQDLEPKVRAALESFGRAMAEQDREAISRHFHIPRLMQELHDRGGLELPETDEEKEKFMGRLRQTMPAMATGLASLGMAWERVRPLSVKVKAGESEAEALGKVLAGGSQSKVRFWLAREGTDWKIFDMEFMEFGIRFSTTLGSAAALVKKDDQAHRGIRNALGSMFRAIKDITSGELDQARESLEAARAAKPPDQMMSWIEVMDAQTLQLLDRHEEALQAADRAHALDPSMAVCHFMKAASFVALEEYEKAIAAEKEFLRLVGNDPEAWGVIGDAYEKLERAELAIEAYQKGAACDEEEYSNRLSLGRLWVEGGKTREAKQVLKEASRNAPPEEDAFQDAAALLDGISEFATVLELAEERAKRTPDDETVLLWQARALRKLGRLKEAETALTKIPSKEREDGEAQEELVFLLAQAGRDREAREEAGKRVEGDAESARYLRFFLLAVGGSQTQALEELRPLLEDDESYADRIRKEPALEKFRLGEEVKKALRPAQERHDFLQSVQKLPSGDREGMLRLARARAEAAPEDPWAFYYQGYALRRLGKFEEAERALAQAVAKSKKPTESYREELGRALAAQGKIEQALAQADEIEKLEDAKEEAQTLRAVAYALGKKPQESIRILRELLKESPHRAGALKSDPDLGELKKLPAFQELMMKKATRVDK